MDLHTRNAVIEQIFKDERLRILNAKGADYATKDSYSNFKHIAETLGVSPEQIMYVYMAKHWDALKKAMSGEVLSGEALDEKLVDIVNYCLIMLAYRVGKKQKEEVERINTAIETFVPPYRD